MFKVPTLRNIELTPPYFHSGKSWDLKQAVGVMATSQLGEHLTDDQITKITAFLKSLTGEQPKVTYPSCRPVRSARRDPNCSRRTPVASSYRRRDGGFRFSARRNLTKSVYRLRSVSALIRKIGRRP